MEKNNLLLLIVIILIGGILRFYNIINVPPGLYIDEVSIGHNAQSILQHGYDEHGNNYPLFFKAFGEYKLPVYIYLTVSSFIIFGINEFAIRFPSAIFGTTTILIYYFFVNEVFRNINSIKTKNVLKPSSIALLSAFLLAISPWHTHFSRGGFEMTVALFFYLLGCLLTLIFWRVKTLKYLLIATLCFIVTVYTYPTFKFVTPITVFVIYGILLFKNTYARKKVSIVLIIFLLSFIPMLLFSFTPQGVQRFAETSAFAEYSAKSPGEKMVLYPMLYLKNYISFFSFDYLFSHGDGNGRHQMPGMGLFFQWQLPFLLLGLVWLLRKKFIVASILILGILLLAPLIPAVARPSPNTLRSLLMVIPLTILISCGILISFRIITKFSKVYAVLLFMLFSYTFVIYLHAYYFHYPKVNALDWGAGYKETAERALVHQKKYKKIVIDKNLSYATIYFKFYSPGIKPIIVDETWYKPKDWNETIIYIRPYYGKRQGEEIIDNIYLPGPNKDIFAQFITL